TRGVHPDLRSFPTRRSSDLDRDVVARGDETGWRQRLQGHLDANDLILNFQPVIDLASGQVVCHEVLVRLPDGAGGLIAPGAFMRSEEHTSELQSRENLVCRL